MIEDILKLFTVLLPWPLRRRALQYFFDYRIHNTARIGLAWVFPKRLTMEEGCSIGHGTVCVEIDALIMKPQSRIGYGNWIVGFPTDTKSERYAHLPARRPELWLGEDAAIASRHTIDCTDLVSIGNFSILAGFGSQLLTENLDLETNRPSAAPVTVGNYCFIGAASVLLPGSALPDRCVLGAKSLLNRKFIDEHSLYTGSPARAIRRLPPEMRFFWRLKGSVY